MFLLPTIRFLWHLPLVITATTEYYIVLLYFLARPDAPIDHAPLLMDKTCALVWVYSLAKVMHLWNEPHYRAPSFQADLRSNLRNVAIPGTGLPLSVFCACRPLALAFLLILNPVASLAGAWYLALSAGGSPARWYAQLLLAPQHWLAIWRLNCVLVAYHAAVTAASSYRLEDKGRFLEEGERLGLPLSPWLRAPALFVKHRGVEGGLGIHVFRSFTAGGDWILQEPLHNSAFLCRLLPPSAPLSTLRIVTASIYWLEERRGATPGGGGGESPGAGAGGRGAGGGGSGLGGGRQGGPELPVSSGVLRRVNSGSALQAALQQADEGGQDRQPGRGAQCGGGWGGGGGVNTATGASNGGSRVGARDGGGGGGGDGGGGGGDGGGGDGGGGGGGGGAQQHSPVQGRLSTAQSPPPLRTTAPGSGGGGGGEGRCESRAELTAVEVVTAVWRAGLEAAATDHASVCFAVDVQSGRLGSGVSNQHWYQTGVRGVGRVGASAHEEWSWHPQAGVRVEGEVIPEFASILSTVLNAHAVMAPDVPLVGWDVALTPDGPLLLELNFSLNFFNGTFDRDGYAAMVYDYFCELDYARLAARRR